MQLDVIQGRFDYVRKDSRPATSVRKFRALLDLSRDEALGKVAALEDEYRRSASRNSTTPSP